MDLSNHGYQPGSVWIFRFSLAGQPVVWWIFLTLFCNLLDLGLWYPIDPVNNDLRQWYPIDNEDDGNEEKDRAYDNNKKDDSDKNDSNKNSNNDNDNDSTQLLTTMMAPYYWQRWQYPNVDCNNNSQDCELIYFRGITGIFHKKEFQSFHKLVK